MKQKGVIKLVNLRHHKIGSQWSGVNPENYRIKDEVEFNVDILSMKPDGTWEPYVTKDVYFQFIMLDPYYNVPLNQVDKTSVYSRKFKVPEKLGVYKFKITHWRYGVTFIEDEVEVSII
jgi:oligosaccharyltransferase complex subunit beta